MTVELHTVEEQAHLIIYDRWVMIAGQAAYFVVIGLLSLFYRPVVPETQMTLWAIVAGSIFVYIILFDVALILRNPSQSELLGFWRAADKKHTILFDIAAVGVIALFLPFGDESHRIVTVAFCVGYVPLQMISDPENVFGNRFSIVSVLGAFTVYLLLQGQTYAYVLAFFVMIYGATLFYSSDVFRNVVVEALRNRRSAEAASAQLALAVRDVSAERDAKTRFIAAASHDLGQPLHAARLFRDQMVGDPPAIVRDRALSGLERSLISAQKMLGPMLHHMQLEADAVTPYHQKIEVVQIITNLSEQYTPSASEAGVEIRVAGRSASIFTDPVLLERAVGNLLQNAITHSGGSRILIACRGRGSEQAIWVIDNGVGIATGDEQAIFDDYERGSNSRASVRGGFGLGLASVKRIARLLGGDVRLDARWKTGAAFCLSLPVQGSAL